MNRRDFIALTATTGACLATGPAGVAQTRMPTRPIPGTSERLPILGLGSSKPVQQIGTLGEDRVADILRELVAVGGSLIDTWPRNPDNDRAFGNVLNRPDLRDRLFVTTKIDQVGEAAGIEQFDQALQNYRYEPIDLAQVFSLTDVDTHWPNLRRWKEEGRARYIGVTVAEDRLHGALETFVRRESPDFVQVNYSITERAAEARLLPFLAPRSTPGWEERVAGPLRDALFHAAPRLAAGRRCDELFLVPSSPLAGSSTVASECGCERG